MVLLCRDIFCWQSFATERLALLFSALLIESGKDLERPSAFPIYDLRFFWLSRSIHRRKFRSQTSDNGEMKKQSAGRRVRREKIRRKKMQVCDKVGKSRNIVFCFGVLWLRRVEK